MSKTQGQHTPGPWTVEGKFYIASPHKVGNVAFVYAKGNPLYDQFANLTGYDDPGQAEANARLIAAAADMIAMHKRIAAIALTWLNPDGSWNQPTAAEKRAILEAARAALEKASVQP